MPEDRTCEECLDEFCRWCHAKVMELKKEEPEEMKVAKSILKETLPGDLGEAISNVQTAPMCPRDLLTLLPEFANKLVQLLDKLCNLHASEVLEIYMPLLSGFVDVLGFSANQVSDVIASEQHAAEKRQKKLDEINPN